MGRAKKEQLKGVRVGPGLIAAAIALFLAPVAGGLFYQAGYDQYAAERTREYAKDADYEVGNACRDASASQQVICFADARVKADLKKQDNQRANYQPKHLHAPRGYIPIFPPLRRIEARRAATAGCRSREPDHVQKSAIICYSAKGLGWLGCLLFSLLHGRRVSSLDLPALHMLIALGVRETHVAIEREAALARAVRNDAIWPTLHLHPPIS